MVGGGVLVVFYINFFLLCGVALRHWFKFIAQVRAIATLRYKEIANLQGKLACQSASAY